MVSVLGVHGIGQQQLGRNTLTDGWGRALADGVELARGRNYTQPAFDLAFYGDVFLSRFGSAGTKAAAIVSGFDADAAGLDPDEITFLAQIGDEIAGNELSLVEPPKGFAAVPEPLLKFAGWLDREFGIAQRALLFGDLVQVRRFQGDQQVRDTAISRVREGIEIGRPKVMIGHSLGSVVAYEALSTIPHHGVETLITLGSPLGLRSIREALTARSVPDLPPGTIRWVNVRDPRDPVTMGGPLCPFWSGVREISVDNGRNDPHSVIHYLTKAETGRAVAEALDGQT